MEAMYRDSSSVGQSSEGIVREIKRRTRKKYTTEEKIRIVLEGLKGEASIAELCRKEGINPNVFYKWSRDFMEAGKKRLQWDTERKANSTEVVCSSTRSSRDCRKSNRS